MKIPISERAQEAAQYFKNLQSQIVDALSDIHGAKPRQDTWVRDGGGGGDTRIFSEGLLLEKGGVNFSEVYGEFTPEFAKSMPVGDGTQFYATGISLVLHPLNPYVPTVHANFRYLERGSAGWYGGGADLTPYYFFKEDAVHFHKAYFEALRPFGEDKYKTFKKNCDEYFYIPHRQETRGMGGIFFDYQLSTQPRVFEMVQSCGNSFLNSYLPIAKKRMSMAWGDKQKEFQEIRRGRYVEFNLVYDRGTTFGLKTNGRIESILMSLPLKARWVYDFKPEPGSHEAQLYEHLKPIEWL